MLGEYFMNNGKDVLVIFDDLTRHAWIYQLLIQDKNSPCEMEEEIIYLYALSLGMLDNLSVLEIKKFKEEVFAKPKEWDANLFAELRNTRDIKDESLNKLRTFLEGYFQKKSISQS